MFLRSARGDTILIFSKQLPVRYSGILRYYANLLGTKFPNSPDCVSTVKQANPMVFCLTKFVDNLHFPMSKNECLTLDRPPWEPLASPTAGGVT